MTHTRLLATVAVLALTTAPAMADEHGFYLGAGLGANILSDADYDNGTNTNDVESDVGFAGLGTVGYQFPNNWRVEGELAARMNDVDTITGTGAAAPFDGDVNVYSLMANALYNIPTGTKFEPYVGAGLGVAWVDVSDMRTLLGGTLDDTDTTIAYQGIAGVEYKVNPRLKADLAYRYFRTGDPEFTLTGTDVDGEYEAHTITVGLRYMLNKPAEAAVAAPAAVTSDVPPPPMVPNNYIVFFDFDRSNVTTEADRVLAAAVDNAKQAQVTRVEVTGHADRSGSTKYNQRLSQRRADVVKSALVAKGIPADQIEVVAKGEGDPLVATKDGVREAQNRRVQIVLK